MAASDIGERYRLEEEIGRGGMGSVWRAYDLLLRRRVAVEQTSAEQLRRPAANDRFQHEAVAIAQLQSPHVVQIYDSSAPGDVVISAFSDIANLRAAMSRGAFDLLVKPIDMTGLGATIKNAIEQSRNLRRARPC